MYAHMYTINNAVCKYTYIYTHVCAGILNCMFDSFFTDMDPNDTEF